MTLEKRSRTKNEELAGYLHAWLDSWDFIGNPFEMWDADKEQPQLGNYYIKPPFYEQLLMETRSALIYAPRGGGKTAARIMVQSECRPVSRSSSILAVQFTDFSPFAEDFTRIQEFTLQNYLEVILQESIHQLVVALCVGAKKEILLTVAQQGELLYWLEHYAPHWRSPSFVNKLMDQTPPFLGGGLIHDSIGENSKKQKISSLLLKLLKIVPLPPSAKVDSSSQIMEAFVRFSLDLLSSGQIPCHAIYLLVDGLDEYLLTHDDPQAGADLLKPLLGNLRFLEIPGFAVKFFLPVEYRSAFDTTTRIDRIPSYVISWSAVEQENDPQSRMRELLRARIRHYSRGGIQSLSEMCTSELRNIIEDALLEEAQGVPRRLLQLGNQIFVEHCRDVPERESEITMVDWERALSWARGTIPRSTETSTTENKFPHTRMKLPKRQKGSLLYIDLKAGRIFVDNLELPPLPDLEFRLLAYLYRRQGEICSREEIIAATYGSKTGIATDTLGSLIYRLRSALSKIAPGLPKQYYIKTVPRRGYVLENATIQRPEIHGS